MVGAGSADFLRRRVSRTWPISTGAVNLDDLEIKQQSTCREYCTSSLIISSKVVLFLPETCHRPVRPGTHCSARVVQVENSILAGNAGRTNQAHVAAENIDDLGQLIERKREVAMRRIRRLSRWNRATIGALVSISLEIVLVNSGIGTDLHRTEFVDSNRRPIADALLVKKAGPGDTSRVRMTIDKHRSRALAWPASSRRGQCHASNQASQKCSCQRDLGGVVVRVLHGEGVLEVMINEVLMVRCVL